MRVGKCSYSYINYVIKIRKEKLIEKAIHWILQSKFNLKKNYSGEEDWR